MLSSSAVLAASWALTRVAHAHSHISNFVIDGGSYQGHNPRGENPANLAAWDTRVPDDGWVGTKDYTSPDFVCHLGATNAQGYATVDAGSDIHFQWAGWPESHKGPVMTYLARCGDDSQSCATVDKTELEFFKVGSGALLDPDQPATNFSSAMGVWATDVLISKNNTFLIEIPPTTPSGFYVLRHEIIALHYATNAAQGPQHYPQCINLHIQSSSSSTALPAGVRASALYRSDEPGLVYDIYQSELPAYKIPGPTLVRGAVAMVEQTATAIPIASSVTATPAAPTRAGEAGRTRHAKKMRAVRN
ncbi:hypothetical protein S7711_03137 [Stachybotrys chartarum IBT 7711]|uniref:lytic cellulose monooxygenase (C4-dehydrogenating) n=1 Tax=Stachybotrys chartarum (strain CBS 109288 / IBT 7711) TaxID=1280523 RepID=A0A084B8G3_STACB|nr:hypothetical protein S7711_03137 [Stachybotrys chartarum IBT 7711]